VTAGDGMNTLVRKFSCLVFRVSNSDSSVIQLVVGSYIDCAIAGSLYYGIFLITHCNYFALPAWALETVSLASSTSSVLKSSSWEPRCNLALVKVTPAVICFMVDRCVGEIAAFARSLETTLTDIWLSHIRCLGTFKVEQCTSFPLRSLVVPVQMSNDVSHFRQINVTDLLLHINRCWLFMSTFPFPFIQLTQFKKHPNIHYGIWYRLQIRFSITKFYIYIYMHDEH
jgi:hypothetical protein